MKIDAFQTMNLYKKLICIDANPICKPKPQIKPLLIKRNAVREENQ